MCKPEDEMIWILITALIIVIDRITKILVTKNVEPHETIPVIRGFFNIVFTENTGAALGILQNGRAFLIPFTIITVFLLLYFLIKSESRLFKTSLSMVIGGALGNLADRVFRGSVVDFLDFQFGSWHFWAFNVADIFIVLGTALMAWYMIFIYKEPETLNKKNNETTGPGDETTGPGNTVNDEK